MSRPTTDRLLEGINRVDSALQRVEQVERTWNDAVNTVNEVRALGENIASTTRALVTDAKSLLSGDLLVGNGLANALNSLNIFPAAKPNELHKFRTFNYIFELSCLSAADFNNSNYRNRRPSQVILRSGGGAEPKTTTQWESRGRVEYFIDNVEIQSHMANTEATGSSSAYSILFDVTEPLSMGLFLQSLQNAAKTQGYGNYLEAAFLLTIEFVGHTDTDQTVNLPITKRYIPIKLYEAKMRVSEAGTVYGVRAIPYNHQTLADSVNTTNSTTIIVGPEDGEGTVQEMLQKGDTSLCGVLNKFFADRAKEQENVSYEEVFVVFPKELAGMAGGGGIGGAADAATGATASAADLLGTLTAAANTTANAVGQIQSGLQAWDVEAPALQRVQQELNNATQIANAAISTVNAIQSLGSGVSSVLSSAIGRIGGAFAPKSAGEQRARAAAGDAEISQAQAAADAFNIGGVQTTREGDSKTLVQDAGSLNDIGSASMGFGQTSGGVSPQANANETYDHRSNTFKRGNITISGNRRQYIFPAGTKITKIIEEVIISSKYGQEYRERADSQGMIDWFTIEPQIYLIGNASDTATGGMSKVYVYRVIPTKVHSSKFQPPTAAGTGYNQIAPNVTKVYDYIYTGKNKDILDFNIEFNMAFVTTVQPDLGNNARPPVGQETTADVEANQQEAAGLDAFGGEGAPIVRPQVRYNNQTPGGVTNETPSIRSARMFHDAILDGAADMVELDMTIMGDPYFLSDSGLGNYTADLGPTTTITADGTMDYQRTQIDIVVNFRTPLDYGRPDGYIEMLSDTVPVSPFSGLYMVTEVRSQFENGEFRQELHLVRRRNQEANLSNSSGGQPTMMVGAAEQVNTDLDNTQAGIQTNSTTGGGT